MVRDLYSGARIAYPLSKRDVESHAKNFRHFVGLKANELATHTLIKMDEAQELEQAAHQVGFVPETSLPNRWPHNALLERDIREEKECCRVVHLQSGLPYEYHTYSYPYACLSMTFDRPSIVDPEKTQWKLLHVKSLMVSVCVWSTCVLSQEASNKKDLRTQYGTWFVSWLANRFWFSL